MMEVLGKEGLKPPHLIGPGMGHKYHPEVIKEVQAWIEKAVAKGRDLFPDEVHMQTKTPFYGRMKWLNLHGHGGELEGGAAGREGAGRADDRDQDTERDAHRLLPAAAGAQRRGAS
jgi:hypothetical protein